MYKLYCTHINNDLNWIKWSSWGWIDYYWFIERTKHCAEIVKNWEDADFVIWFQSNLNAFWGVLWDKSINKYYEICKLSETKPILYMFSDFLILLNIQDKMLQRFGKDVPMLNKDNLYIVHYCMDNDWFRNYWNSKSTTFKTDNFIYRDLSQNYLFNKQEIIDIYVNKVCYIGNNRAWNRNKFLSKFKDVDIYGKRPEKFILEWNTYFDKIDWKYVWQMLNQYFGQLCTYDDIGIKYKATNYRIIATLMWWCLPIIDYKLKYIWLPDEYSKLFIYDKEWVNKLLSMSYYERKDIIQSLREWFDWYFKQFNYEYLFNLIEQRHVKPTI